MKSYYVDIRWDHKGNRYPCSEHLRVSGTSIATAANKAIRQVKKTNRASWREPAGASVRIDVLVIGDEGKVKGDGGRGRVQQSEES
jgi:hypothetical protein